MRPAATVLALLLGGAAAAQTGAPVAQEPPNVPEFAPAFPGQTRAPESLFGVTLAAQPVAEGLENPWGIAVLPDGAILVTERPGRLRVIRDGALVAEPVAGVPEVWAEEQGGLLDVAIGPDFAEDRLVFLTYAKPVDGGSATAAARGRLSEDMTELTDVRDVFVQTPPSESPMHYGSRLAFDGRGHVFVTTGERFTEEERVLAQDLGATYGKVVRVGLDGDVPADNPFVDRPGARPEIWTYGHRNVQSAAIDAQGRLWTVEHGPQGGDELNLIEPGANYGWPVISYGENYDGTPVGAGETAREGMTQPVYYWDPVIAPGGMTFYDGALFPDWDGDLVVASLNPGAVVRLEIAEGRVTGEERLFTGQGRVRDVAVAADGALLVAIDDPDGSVLRLAPEASETQ
jgi:glucose/arabinose dehydrogenase